MTLRGGIKQAHVLRLSQNNENDTHANAQEDEISLIELCCILIRRKYLILSLVVISTLAALLYVLSTPATYKEKISFLPPYENDIRALNFNGYLNVSTESVFAEFSRNLLSRSFRKPLADKMNMKKGVLSKYKNIQGIDAILSGIDDKLSVEVSKSAIKDQFPDITLSLEGENPYLIMDVLNLIAEETSRITISGLVANLRTRISFKVKEIMYNDALARKNIEDKINILRQTTRQKRLDRIVLLKKAEKIAHELDIDYPLEHASGYFSDQSKINTDISHKDLALYYNGTKALKSEINTLTNISNDDPFIARLRDLQAKLYLLDHNRELEKLKSLLDDTAASDSGHKTDLLKAIYGEGIELKSARWDQSGSPSALKIKPKSGLIIVLGILLGLSLGIICAFFAHIFEFQQKSRMASNKHIEKNKLQPREIKSHLFENPLPESSVADHQLHS